MILYHGTNISFDIIDLNKCMPHKDFGRGFYLTESKNRAYKRALDKCDKENVGEPVVLSFEFDERQLSALQVKRFEGTNEEWLEFILNNRSKKSKKYHIYDIVIGPVADDGVITSISLYEAHVIDKDTLLKRLQYTKPYIQYCFCTQKAIDLLVKK